MTHSQSHFNIMSTAVIGCGYWGKHYVRILSELEQCAWVIDASEVAREALARRFGLECAASYSTAFADPNVKNVVVATPASTHASIVRAALLAGKNVLVEKPLTLQEDTAAELVELACNRGLTLMVGHTFLFNSRLGKLREIVDDAEKFGELRYITCRRTNLGPIRNDCSVLWDLAPHDVSILQALKGGMYPTLVSATGAAVLPLSTFVDVAFITIFYPDETIGQIHVSWCDPHKVRHVTAIGSKMRVCFDDMDFQRPITCFHQGVHIDPQNQERSIFSDGDIVIPQVETNEPLGNVVKEFLSACVDCHADRATGEEVGGADSEEAVSKKKLQGKEKRDVGIGNSCCFLSDGKLGWVVVKILAAAEASLMQNGAPIGLEWE